MFMFSRKGKTLEKDMGKVFPEKFQTSLVVPLEIVCGHPARVCTFFWILARAILTRTVCCMN